MKSLNFGNNLAFFFIALALGCTSSTPSEKNLSKIAVDRLMQWGVTAEITDADQIVRESSSESKGEGVSAFEIREGNDASLIVTRFQTRGSPDAESLKSERIVKFQSIYDSHRDPYFAVLTKATFCRSEFLPKHEVINRKSGVVDFFVTYANERNTLGVCSPSMAVKRATLTLFTCGRSLFQVEYFFPVSEEGRKEIDLARSFQCVR